MRGAVTIAHWPANGVFSQSLSMDSNAEVMRLLALARAGDNSAAETLVQRYGSLVRRLARVRLSSATLRLRFDEEDACQSVFASFFEALRTGRITVTSEIELLGFLSTVTKRCVLKEIERHHAAKRDVRKESELEKVASETVSDESTASVKISREEQVALFMSKLSDKEKFILEERRLGKSWEEIAAKLHTTVEALQVRIRRASQAFQGALNSDR